jgi:uncharacterized protein
MNVLYIHGLDSQPNPNKLEILKKHGHKPFALSLDYRKDLNAYNLLHEYALKNKIEFIVGNSLGGYFGYWLGHDLKIAQLLFNPAMPFRSVKVQSHNIDERSYLQSFVVLGALDDTIPANLNVNFFASKPNVKLITCHWLGHEVDTETFELMLPWAGL